MEMLEYELPAKNLVTIKDEDSEAAIARTNGKAITTLVARSKKT